MQIGILEPNQFSKKAISNLKKIGSVKFFDEKKCNLAEFLSDRNIIFVRLKYYLGKELLKEARQLKYICSPTTGHNHIDCEYLNSKKINLISLKNEYQFLTTIRATPEHTFGLVLSLLRNYKFAFCGDVQGFSDRESYKGEEIYQKNIGIIGFGRVGQIISKYFISFGANVAFYDIKDVNYSDYIKRIDTLELLIESSDVIILCASYSVDNIGMINEKMLDLLQGKYFINTARGELIDEEKMLEKIQSDHFKGLALDVLSSENGSHNLNTIRQYSKTKNIIITPHIAGVTYESMSKTEEFIVQKLNNTLKLKYE
jgi:D-3-phosphoglycerate dehydrogenase / 2-oxoglutarate reductase